MAAFNDLLTSHEANATAADFARAKIGSMVRDPEVAATLTPKNIIGAKRLCVDTGYYATYNRPNVTLIDVGERPIERITSRMVYVPAAGLSWSMRSSTPPGSTP